MLTLKHLGGSPSHGLRKTQNAGGFSERGTGRSHGMGSAGGPGPAWRGLEPGTLRPRWELVHLGFSLARFPLHPFPPLAAEGTRRVPPLRPSSESSRRMSSPNTSPAVGLSGEAAEASGSGGRGRLSLGSQRIRACSRNLRGVGVCRVASQLRGWGGCAVPTRPSLTEDSCPGSGTEASALKTRACVEDVLLLHPSFRCYVPAPPTHLFTFLLGPT